MYSIQIKVPKQVLVDLKRRRLCHNSSTKGLGWLGKVCIWIIQESGECVAWIITSSHSAHQLHVLLPYSLPSPTNQSPQHFIQPNHLGKSVFFSGMNESKNSEVTISRNFALPPSNLGNPPGNGAQPWPLGSRCNKSLTLATIQDLLQPTSLIPGNPQDALLSLHNWSSGCWPCFLSLKPM